MNELLKVGHLLQKRAEQCPQRANVGSKPLLPFRSQPVRGPGTPPEKRLLHLDDPSFLQRPKVLREVSICYPEQTFEALEVQFTVLHQEHQNPEPHSLVEQGIKIPDHRAARPLRRFSPTEYPRPG